MSTFIQGYYVESSRPDSVNLTVEEMAAHMKTEIVEGCEGTSIKCGVIGEIGCSWPLEGILKKYSQTCIKRSPLGQRKSDLLRQVSS